MTDNETLPLFAGKPHHDLGDEGHTAAYLSPSVFPAGVDTCRGVVVATWAHMATITGGDNVAIANIIGSTLWREGCLELDRLCVAGDLETTKMYGRGLIARLKKIAKGVKE